MEICASIKGNMHFLLEVIQLNWEKLHCGKFQESEVDSYRWCQCYVMELELIGEIEFTVCYGSSRFLMR